MRALLSSERRSVLVVAAIGLIGVLSLLALYSRTCMGLGFQYVLTDERSLAREAVGVGRLTARGVLLFTNEFGCLSIRRFTRSADDARPDGDGGGPRKITLRLAATISVVADGSCLSPGGPELWAVSPSTELIAWSWPGESGETVHVARVPWDRATDVVRLTTEESLRELARVDHLAFVDDERLLIGQGRDAENPLTDLAVLWKWRDRERFDYRVPKGYGLLAGHCEPDAECTVISAQLRAGKLSFSRGREVDSMEVFSVRPTLSRGLGANRESLSTSGEEPGTRIPPVISSLAVDRAGKVAVGGSNFEFALVDGEAFELLLDPKPLDAVPRGSVEHVRWGPDGLLALATRRELFLARVSERPLPGEDAPQKVVLDRPGPGIEWLEIEAGGILYGTAKEVRFGELERRCRRVSLSLLVGLIALWVSVLSLVDGMVATWSRRASG